MRTTALLLCSAVLSAVALSAAEAATRPSDELYTGWMALYDLRFDAAHVHIDAWEKLHPSNPMGPVSHAAGYLFSEFHRLGVLESELFVGDGKFKNREKRTVDPEARQRTLAELDKADKLADLALTANPKDEDALLGKTLLLGLRADYFAMIEKQNFQPLKLTKLSREFADRLLLVDPHNYDAYLGPGFENYLLSQKNAALRMVLNLTGSQTDKKVGVEQLQKTADKGHFLEPYAKLLLAVAALRDKDIGTARNYLEELHRRFPNNALYTRELGKLGSK